jgi:hypothetical protein
MEKPFRSLFAGPLTQTSTSGHPTQTQPDPPRNVTAERPASHSLEAMFETQKPVGKPFRSLFAGPISQTTLPDPPTQTWPYTPIVKPKQKERDPTPSTGKALLYSIQYFKCPFVGNAPILLTFHHHFVTSRAVHNPFCSEDPLPTPEPMPPGGRAGNQ